MTPLEYRVPQTEQSTPILSSKAYQKAVHWDVRKNLHTTDVSKETEDFFQIKTILDQFNQTTKGKYDVYAKDEAIVYNIYQVLKTNTVGKDFIQIYMQRYPKYCFYDFPIGDEIYLQLIIRQILQDIMMDINPAPYCNPEEWTLLSSGKKNTINIEQRSFLKDFWTKEQRQQINQVVCITTQSATQPLASGKVVLPQSKTFFKSLPISAITTSQEQESIENEEIMHIFMYEFFGKYIAPNDKIYLIDKTLQTIYHQDGIPFNQVDEFCGAMADINTTPENMALLFADAIKEEVNKTIDHEKEPQYGFKRQWALYILKTMILNDQGFSTMISTYKQIGRTKESRLSITSLSKKMREKTSPTIKHQVMLNMKEMYNKLLPMITYTKRKKQIDLMTTMAREKQKYADYRQQLDYLNEKRYLFLAAIEKGEQYSEQEIIQKKIDTLYREIMY